MPATITDTLKSRCRREIDRGVSVNALAKAAGIPQPVLYRWVHDERDMYLSTADKLAAYFGLKLTAPKK